METLKKLKIATPPPALAGLLAALFYFVFSSLRLDAQGLYYDELHQAVGAFAYIGRPNMNNAFISLTWQGFPLLNMTYSGAIKTAIYGLYLRLTSSSFGVSNWRLTGILFVTGAILFFGLHLRKSLPRKALLVFFFFLITDLNFILTTRFDWGPAALAAALRLVLIAIWLRGEFSAELKPANSFWLGVLAGLSIFEKLSSVVLLIALFFMIFGSSRRRTPAHILAVMGGGLLGCIPLILVNIYSYASQGSLISLHFYSTQRSFEIFEYLNNFLSLGAGQWAQSFVLGGASAFPATLETLLLIITLCALGLAAVRAAASDKLLQAGLVMLLAYLGIAIGYYYFPEGTLPYHWMVGTPFQYAAMGLFLAAAVKQRPLWAGLGRRFVLGLLVIFVLFRVGGVVSLEQSLWRGDAAIAWDPSLNSLGQFAVQKAADTTFISGDWGVGNQLICFLENQPGGVYELQWDAPDAGKQIAALINRSQHANVYVVFPSFYTFTTLQTRPLLIQQIFEGLAPGWQQQPVEAGLQNLKAVSALRFVKVK